MKLDKTDALRQLAATTSPFKTLFEHGSLSVEIYRPVGKDLQQPHARDEVYVILSGHGEFLNDGVRTTFQAGDLLFVPAGVVHRFENFSEDFATWVLFYGPDGGEKPKKRDVAVAFERVTAANLPTYREVGEKSYREHYLHLWPKADPTPYLRNSFSPEVLDRELRDPGTAYFIIRKNRVAAGIIKLLLHREISHYTAEDALLLEKLYLLREFAGQGLGARSLRFVEAMGRQLGKKALWLDAMQKGPALPFYIREGFRIIGEKMLPFEEARETEKPMYLLLKALEPGTDP